LSEGSGQALRRGVPRGSSTNGSAAGRAARDGVKGLTDSLTQVARSGARLDCLRDHLIEYAKH